MLVGLKAGGLWLCVALLLQVVQELSSNVVVIEKLENFQYKDKNGKDFGENVRHRAKQLAELIIDPDRIRDERRKVQRGIAHCLTLKPNPSPYPGPDG